MSASSSESGRDSSPVMSVAEALKRSTSFGGQSSSFCSMPSSPAAMMRARAVYWLQEGSGERSSILTESPLAAGTRIS